MAEKLETFLRRIEKKSRLSKDDRLRILDQALLLLEMNYVHLPLKRAMHAIDPIRRLKLLRFRMEETTDDELENELQFHKRLLEIFASLRDLHTRYQLPPPFQEQMAFLPFLIEQYFVPKKPRKRSAKDLRRANRLRKEKGDDQDCKFCKTREHGFTEKFMISRVARKFLRTRANAGPEVVFFEDGVEILSWNGVRIRRAIELNGETQAGGNLEARFAQGLDSLTSRPLDTSLPPDESRVSITYRSKKGKILTRSNLEWMVDTADATQLAIKTTKKKRASIDIRKTKINQLKKRLYRKKARLPRKKQAVVVTREVRVGKEFKEIFYAQAMRVNRKEIGYIRLFSFDVDVPKEFVHEFRWVIKSKDFPQEGLIIDVRGNGGGKIPAGERLLQLFTPRRIKPELFEFISSPVNLEICKRAPKNWELEKWRKSIEEAVKTGAIYSLGFPLNDEESCNDIGQVYHGPVILVTDALSYSTTDMFAAGFQDNEIGEVLGASDNTGAGGANNWSYEDLMKAMGKKRRLPFKPLPKGAEIGVAMRRSIRVGRHVGKLLEELGIQPDHRHYTTKNDLLDGNVDLITHAVERLSNKPIYSLSVKPFKRKTGRGVKVIAKSKVSPDQPLQKISYLNIFLNGRVHPPPNEAKDGAIETEVILPKNRRKSEVLVQAFDGAKNLVAAYRHE